MTIGKTINWSVDGLNPTVSVASPGAKDLDLFASDLLTIDLGAKAPTATDTIDGAVDDGHFISDTLEIIRNGGATVNFADFANVSGFEFIVLDPGTASSFSATLTSTFVANNLSMPTKSFQIVAHENVTAPITIDASGITLASANEILVLLGNGNDTYTGYDGLDYLELFSGAQADGDDSINLGGGNDIVVASLTYLTSADTLDGGAGGLDELALFGNATIDGATTAFDKVSGFERFAIGSDSRGSYDITLTDALMPKLTGNTFNVFIGSKLEFVGDTVKIDGSALTSTFAINVVANQTGSGAELTLIGGAGADTLRAGDAGAVTLHGGAGADSLFGGANVGIAVLHGDAGPDTIIAGGGQDSINGGTEADILIGNAGNDTIVGGDGADSLSGGSEADSLVGGIGDDVLQGGLGDDTLVGATAGGQGSDTLTGGSGADIFQFYAGGDWTITDFAFGDKIALFAGGVPLPQAASPSAVGAGLPQGGWWVDTVAGGVVIGLSLDTTPGAADAGLTLLGPITPADVISDGAFLRLAAPGGGSFTSGADTLTGTSGNDSFLVPAGANLVDSADQIDGGSGTDRILLAAGANADFSTVAANKFTSIEIIESVTSASVVLPTNSAVTFLDGSGTDNVTVDGTGQIVFLDSGGGDTVELVSGSSTVVLTNGTAAIESGTHTVHLFGSWTLNFDSSYTGITLVQYGFGNLNGDVGNDVLYRTTAGFASGGLGNDQLVGSSGSDHLHGGEGADTLFGGDGNDSIGGYQADDNYAGDTHNDLLVAGFGDDTIVVGGGNDTAWGQDGNDTFVINDVLSGSITLADYEAGELVDFYNNTFIDEEDVEDALDTAEVFDNAIRLDFGGLVITVVGITDARDFYYFALSGGQYGD